MARRGRGAELNALRQKKKDEKTGSTTKKSQSSVSSNKNGGGRTGGLTRQDVQQKVSRSAGYTSSGKAKQPAQTQKTNPYATTRNIVNRSNNSKAPERASRTSNRINSSNTRGREQAPIDRRQTFATAVEMREARENERLKRNPAPTAKKMLEEREKNKDSKFAETVKNTGGASKKGLLDAASGHAQAALDTLSGLTSNEQRNYTWLRAAELSAGIDNKAETRKAAKGTLETSKQLDEERKKLNAEQEKRQEEFDKKTKNSSGLQKAIYGAAESGTGMATDLAIGRLTGTGQAGSLASMFSRTYGTTRGQAEKEGATENEDRLYAGLQAVKEVGTELMFPGVGLAKGFVGKGGIKAGEKLANALTKNMRGKAADVAYAGFRMLGGITEENLEELAGWGLDPFIQDIAYGRNVRARAKESLMSDLPEITSREQAEALTARLNSDSYVNELAAEFKANGLRDKEAKELATKMRDFYAAYYSGDTEKADEIGDDLAGDLTGVKKISKESFNTSELIETIASTTLLTATTGLPGTISTAQRGDQIKQGLKADGLKALAKEVMNSEDAEASERGKIAQAALESGKDITSTQAYDLEQGLYQQQEKDVKRQIALIDTASKQANENGYVAPYTIDEYGRITSMEKATRTAYNEAAESASETLDHVDTKESLTDIDKAYGARAIAGFKTGAFTVDDANTIVADETIKDAFKAETGIDLKQYEVKNRDGSINIPKTNAATKDALFAMATDNLVKMAETETANWKDVTKGETLRQVTARMGAKGGVAAQLVLNDVDERDTMQYRTMTAVSDYVYQSALNLGVSWEDAKDSITSQFSTIPEEKLRTLYDAGLADRQASTDKMLGLQTKIGEAMSKSAGRIDPTKGNLFIETEETPGSSATEVFRGIAESLGIDIYIVDDLPIKDSDRQANGQYVKGDIYINVNSTFEENLGFIFMHEVTHHLKQYAPEQYKALENLVREEWFKANPEEMQDRIARKIKTYEDAGQTLTEEEALEEIIADSTHEFLMDKNFAEQVSKKDPSLAKAVLSAIKNLLRKLRQIFSSGNYANSETQMDAIFGQLGMMEEAEKLWLDAYTEAVKNKAAVGLVEWQDNVNAQSSLSVSDDFTIQDGNARWTDERIDDLIQDYGASDSNYSQAYAALINPRDYLKLTLRDEMLNRWNEGANDPEHPEVYSLDEERLRRSGRVPRLYIHSSDNTAQGFARIDGHEGRHRMRALWEAGIESVPVAIIDMDTKYSKKNEPVMTLMSQDFGNGAVNDDARVGLWDLVPIKESNRDELIQKFGGEAQVRFSMSEPVEQVRDLIAIHNLPEWKLKSTLELGGFPMPSIAVTNQDWTDFGDISILFGSDTIDPKKNRDNKVYSADAWTPTVPQTEYESDHMVVSNVYNTVKDLVGDEPYYRHGISGELHYQSIEQGLRNERGLDGYIERLLDTPYMQYAYLKSQGKEITIPQKDVKEEKDWKEARVDKYNELINMYGEDGLMDLIKMPMTDLFEREDVKQFIEDNLIKRKEGLSRPGKFAQRLYQDYIVEAVAYSMDADKTIGTKSVNDYSAANKMMDEQIDRDSMKAWLEGLFNGIIKDSGVYNGKDFFTPAGNSRTFKQLHYPATVDGIVRAMREQGEKNVSNYTSTKTLRADTAKSFKSLDEIRSRKDKLKSLTDNEVEAIYKELDDKFYSILNSIGEKSPREYDVFAADYIADVISECAQKNYSKPEQIIKQFAEYNWIASTEDANNILQLFNAIENMPVNMFEAKPRRAVGFNEIKAAIVPDNTDPSIIGALEGYGIPVSTYESSNDEDRINKVNEAAEAQDIRFSLTQEQQQRDDDYMSAVNSGNMEEAQRLVDEAAKEAGYGTRLYHGTTDFGFTQIQTTELESKSDGGYYDWSPFFATDSLDVAQTYSSTNDVKRISEASEPFDEYEFEDGYYDAVTDVIGAINSFAENYNYLDYDSNLFRKAYEELQNTSYPVGQIIEGLEDEVSEMISEIAWQRANDEAEANPDENRDISDYADEIQESDTANIIWEELGVVSNMLRQYDRAVYGDSLSGNYELFANTDNLLEVDAKGKRWNQISYNRYATEDAELTPYEEIFGAEDETIYNTRQLAKMAREQGYPGIKISNVFDDGGKGRRQQMPATVFIFFNPQSQVKSSDPVTYAEDGSVIPLSERFDPNNNDIRYSLPTQDSDGNVLTDGQMDYFKNSQARDEQGRLVPVYHSTKSAGFTIFDPSFSKDGRSLFFTDRLLMSQSYLATWRDDSEPKMLDAYNMPDEPTEGTYAVYLNLQNPLIIDAKEHNWDDIPYLGTAKQVRNISLRFTPEWGDTEEGDPLVMGYALKLSWESLDSSGEWAKNNASEFFENPDPSDLEFDPKQEMETFAMDIGLSRSLLKDLMSDAEEEPMDGSLRYESEDEEETIDVYDTAYTTREIAEMAQGEGYDGVIIRNVRDYGGLGYGFDPSDVYIAFSSNQVKDTRNENPSENPDIRYSIPPEDETMNYAQTNAETTDNLWYTDPVMHEGAIRYSMSKKDFINGTTDKWNPAWKTEGRVLKEKSVEKDIRNVIMGAMRNSDTSAKYRQKVVKDTMLVARKAFDYMKSDEHTKAAALLYDHAHSIIEDLEFFGNQDESEFQRYKELKEYLRKTKITVPEDKRSDIDYEAFRRNNFHKILLGDGGIAPDKVWGHLNELWPEAFSEDIKGDIPGIMLQIENALDIYKPYAEAYSSEQCEEFAGDIANSLWDIIYEGEEYKSLADKYDDKAKAMKLRHQEAMRKVKENYKEKLTKQALDAKRKEYRKLDEQKARLADKHEQELSKTKEKYERKLKTQQRKADFEIATLKQNREYNIKRLQAEKKRAVEEERRRSAYKVANNRREQRERQMHRTLYDRILKEYKDLTHRLLNPSKDKTKNIPEQLRQPLAQMLYCFDLEKERSKKLEEMYMIPTRSQLNFRQLKDAMEQVVKEDPTAYEMSDIHKYLKDKMTDLADRVDGKSIDALDEADMQIVKDLLSGLNKAIKDGQQLEIDGENYQKQVQCDKVGEGAAEHQKIYGKAKTYDGARKIVDNILNMGELTPIYFFKGIPGMYDMYRQLRTGFDEYVRNENEIIDKIADILAPYYKTNRKGQRVQGSEIEDWRHAETAETFDLISGDQTITLTIAQRMALYCLAKRSQAQGHMYSENGGIVASEITAGSKITKAKESVKGKIVEQKPVVLTPADVDNIIASLTDDQVKIAEQLQDLMSKDMSVLGNKASMKLTGIEMYKEDNYFPIKVQGDSRPTDIDNIGIREKIRNPGFSNPLIENAQNPIIVDDIFTVVASHCNEMNQYASYAVPITSFMKVYNGSVLDENNKPVKIKTLIRQTYGDKAITYIENFIDDINGNSFKRQGGLDDVLDKALGQAKKAAVFANLRVALQQPTAIVRAFAALDPKYFKGVKPSPKATQEMIEHCPIAQWKAWGYYDTHFGRDIEDVMMGKNVPNKMDYFMSEIYGALDNMTWGMIWQAVKNEVKTTNKGVDENSQEFWDLCNERASYVFDTTQVVDSPFHRSNDMRSKNGLVKQLTSFQAEPTLSFNVLRQGLVDAIEASKTGNNSKARKVILKTLTVWTVQALTVALAQSFVDALRRKGKKDGDDDKDEMLTWYQEIAKYFLRNFGNNLADDMNPINNVYFFKDIVPPILNAIKGEYVFGQQNLTFQWVDSLTTGIEHCRMKWEKGDAYSKSWYDCISELLGGLGYFAGVPAKTMMRGVKNAWHWFNKVTGANVFADDGSVVDSTVESVVSRFRGSGESSASESSGTKTGSSEGGTGEPNTTREERDKAIRKEADKIKGSVADKTGEDREKATWKKVTDFIKENEGKSVEELVASGDYDILNKYRVMYVYAGNTKDYFDQRIFDESKSAMKKSILYDPTEQQTMAQQNIKDYLTANGMSEADLSEIAYKSETKKDLAVACRIGDEDAMVESLVPLIRAGLTYEDFVKIYDNRNRVDLKKYKDKGGRYASKLKSMGTFIWPTEGVITSHFGYRDAPAAGASSNHPAIDIGASQGTPVVAADGGVVIYAGSNGGYGNSVGIKHDNGMVTYYNHLYAWNVKVGDTVGQGQQIAQVGSTGISTGPHLDFKILDKNGKPVDPEKYLN